MTNDGHAILRELSVAHPAARAVIELARAQDENTGDGTTTVTVLAGELLALAEGWLTRKVHPRTLIAAYSRALQDALGVLALIARPVDIKSDVDVLQGTSRPPPLRPPTPPPQAPDPPSREEHPRD